MVSLPDNFTTSNEAIASYDYFDFSSKTGYRKFYPVGYIDSVGNKYTMTNSTVEGDFLLQSLSVTNTSTELNFDYTFQSPCIIQGTAWINFFLEITNIGTETTTAFTVYHVDLSSTETSIGTVTTSTYTNDGAGREMKRLAVVTLSNKSFAIGEKLRLSIVCTAGGGGGGGPATWYFDPSGRHTGSETGIPATISSDMVFYVPFKIDL